MKRYAWIALIALSLGSSFAFADEDHGHDCDDGHCEVPTKEVCFNLVCYYNNEHNPEKFKSCKFASTFRKKVTIDGGEVVDDSHFGNNPTIDLECDGKDLYPGSARRFTDLLGTRIQGEAGPHPAITLPRGALHSGSEDNRAGDHQAPSTLELDSGYEVLRTKGTCYIWTGNP
ncbi:MAG: hypothetical protein ACXVBW_03900 [Bdellovibrionota bacterium]